MPRPLRALAALAVVGALATGCVDDRPDPNDVDEARFTELVDEPPFDAEALGGTWREREPDRAPGSTNALASRGTLSTDLTLTAVDSSLPAAWQRTLPSARSLAEILAGEGWSLVAVSCEPPRPTDDAGSVALAATRALDDGAVVLLHVTLGATPAATAYVPFHAEPDDPWASTALDGPTCLDAATPPADGQTTGTFPDAGVGVPR